MTRRFEGKVALVTGATTGIGQATAVRLASDGALVGVNRKPGIDAAETLEKIKAAGGEGFAVEADMRDPAAGHGDGARRSPARGGRLDYVVSNAAINPFMPWDATSIDDFDELFETNVRGAWVVCTEGAKQMIAEGHGGAIVMVSSISAHVGSPNQVAYCGTKGAISMLGKALGSVLGGNGIRVNVVEPGAVDDQHERADARYAGRDEILPRPHRAAPHRRAVRACGDHRLPALGRCELRHLGDAAGRRRLHRQRRALSAPARRLLRQLRHRLLGERRLGRLHEQQRVAADDDIERPAGELARDRRSA